MKRKSTKRKNTPKEKEKAKPIGFSELELKDEAISTGFGELELKDEDESVGFSEQEVKDEDESVGVGEQEVKDETISIGFDEQEVKDEEKSVGFGEGELRKEVRPMRWLECGAGSIHIVGPCPDCYTTQGGMLLGTVATTYRGRVTATCIDCNSVTDFYVDTQEEKIWLLQPIESKGVRVEAQRWG